MLEAVGLLKISTFWLLNVRFSETHLKLVSLRLVAAMLSHIETQLKQNQISSQISMLWYSVVYFFAEYKRITEHSKMASPN